VKVENKYDLAFLSAGGHPKDINMVQAQKSLDRISPILADNAKVIFFAECGDGYGNDYFKEFFDRKSADLMLTELLTDYQINRQTAYNLRSKLESFDVYLYTDLPESDCVRMGFIKLTNLIDAEKLAENAENIAYIPNAYNILPSV
jgi:nickel-dependent lactate racemase